MMAPQAVRSRLGANTSQVYCVKMEEDNPLGIDPDPYWFAITGWMPVCCNAFVDSNDVGIVVKTSGAHPDARYEVKPRQQDLGRYSDEDPTRKGCQPHLVHFPIKHANYWHGVKELCGMIRYFWQCGQMVVFLDNDGGYRATTAAAVVLAAMTGKDSFHWLPTLMYYREVPALFQDFYHYRVHKPDPTWFPRDYQHYVYWCRMVGFEAKMTEHNRLLGLALTPPGTPRGAILLPGTTGPRRSGAGSFLHASPRRCRSSGCRRRLHHRTG